MKVEVTQGDVNTGLTRSYTLDSVAKAVKRAVQKRFAQHPPFQVLICNLDYIFIHGCMVDMPPVVAEFIKAQDKEQPVQPFTFELPDLPDDFFQKEYAHA